MILLNKHERNSTQNERVKKHATICCLNRNRTVHTPTPTNTNTNAYEFFFNLPLKQFTSIYLISSKFCLIVRWPRPNIRNNEQRGHVLVFVCRVARVSLMRVRMYVCMFVCLCFTEETHLFIHVWVLQAHNFWIMLEFHFDVIAF